MNSSIEACTQPDPRASSPLPAFSPDLILANQIAYGQVHCAEALGVPLHIISNIPWLPSKVGRKCQVRQGAADGHAAVGQC